MVRPGPLSRYLRRQAMSNPSFHIEKVLILILLATSELIVLLPPTERQRLLLGLCFQHYQDLHHIFLQAVITTNTATATSPSPNIPVMSMFPFLCACCAGLCASGLTPAHSRDCELWPPRACQPDCVPVLIDTDIRHHLCQEEQPG